VSEARRIRGGRTRAHFRGCLVGGAVGDALGAAVEFKTWEEIRSEFGPAGLRDYSMCYRRIGAITDDTQMTLFTAEALLRAEHLRHRAPAAKVAEVAWHAYLRWLETQGDVVQRRGIPDEEGWLVRMKDLHARRGPGNTCLSALRKGRMGTPEIPINDGKGCGGVMRVAPVGFAPGHPFRTGCELAAITHGHPTGWLAAGYLAQLVHDVAEGATLDEGAVRALDVLRRHPGHEETAAAVEKALWMSRAPRGTTADVEALGGGWVAEEALAIGLYAALAAQDFEHGVLLAVNHSGDSDSTASIAGSLLGLALGELAIPRRWVERLELRDVIEQVADDLHRHYGTGSLPCEGGQCGSWARYPPS
jgi:ADP-ribosyl-[dinitrogen reductase] hydrolase